MVVGIRMSSSASCFPSGCCLDDDHCWIGIGIPPKNHRRRRCCCDDDDDTVVVVVLVVDDDLEA